MGCEQQGGVIIELLPMIAADPLKQHGEGYPMLVSPAQPQPQDRNGRHDTALLTTAWIGG